MINIGEETEFQYVEKYMEGIISLRAIRFYKINYTSDEKEFISTSYNLTMKVFQYAIIGKRLRIKSTNEWKIYAEFNLHEIRKRKIDGLL